MAASASSSRASSCATVALSCAIIACNDAIAVASSSTLLPLPVTTSAEAERAVLLPTSVARALPEASENLYVGSLTSPPAVTSITAAFVDSTQQEETEGPGL